ncbi:hypothetical protein SAMN02745225_01364 [Ferrithrix thermotolerans DSM 19514]|uniref:Pyrroline-5-carboxylate reductase catalytic N-terminal domain-containing protein n=1 Tax=Ferrithrix thermotolerans DSM 19514 TaxID=1121881 RepID=A0A1M4VLT0_9ACTN|nr:NADPH-dependent F420 reductase [Ferrithrix thermotolerans]SHE69845.1 hypothetical protein SAMN02745225_01364 [Ferrithrix thermotolerans DSM 19514]
MARESIGVIGGTGPLGRGLSIRLAMSGRDVTVGSRDETKARSLVEELDLSDSAKAHIQAGSNEDAAKADLVVVSTPWEAIAQTLKPIRRYLEGKTVVTVANALQRVNTVFEPIVPARGSVASMVSSILPHSDVIAAFQHVPAKELLDIKTSLHTDVLVCGDSAEAKRSVMDVFSCIDGLRFLDAGTLAVAGAVEAMTAVLLNLNVKYKAQTSISISGIEA